MCPLDFSHRPSEMEATNLSPVSPQDLAQHFDETRLFISEGLASGKVLVHCTEGRSRSVAILVAFLMQKEKISLGKAGWKRQETPGLDWFNRQKGSKLMEWKWFMMVHPDEILWLTVI